MMASTGPESDQAEDTRGEKASPDTSKQQPLPAADIAPGSCHETPTVQTATKGDVGVGLSLGDGASLSELRSSLQTIGNGVEELATTVHDLLGLSDSDSSMDYDRHIDGSKTFSWARLKSHAASRRRRRQELKNAQGDGQVVETDSSESDHEANKKPQVVSEVRECNYEQFYSRPAVNTHKVHCIDTLVAGDSLDEEAREFSETVAKVQSRRIESWKPDHVSSRTATSNSEDNGKKWIRQLRINSRVVMDMLRCVCPNLKGYRGRPTVFFRPFQLLVSSHEEIKERLRSMTELNPDNSDGGSTPNDSDGPLDSNQSRNSKWDDFIRKWGGKADALDQLTCFVDFMDTRIMPDSRRYRDQSSSLPKTIRYEDLWYLFKPGDLIYVNRTAGGQLRTRPTSSAQHILRVIQTSLTNAPSEGPIGMPKVEGRWNILAHFIEYDGASYGATHYICRPILPFRGEANITELPVYPISYLEDEQIMSQALLDGATYSSLIHRRAGYYSGWTLTMNAHGIRMRDVGQRTRWASPEHIESDILVDFQETFNAFPDWRSVPYLALDDSVKTEADVFQLERSDFWLLERDSLGQAKRHDNPEQVLLKDVTELIEAKRFLAEDTLGVFRKRRSEAPTGDYLALLPRRFFAYAVLERKFVPLDTRFVRSADLEANDKAFEKLEIDRNYKRLILALVKSHFDKVEAEKKTNVEIETQDLIRGKGKGIVILLHGVPGVGKTATAEAVALKWKKPLFPITCGDLGYTAETLEKSLNEIFRLAHHWGCILLLDEADVFITQRERHDLKRNALVSGEMQNLNFEFNLGDFMLTFSQLSSGFWSTTTGSCFSPPTGLVFWTRPSSQECT